MKTKFTIIGGGIAGLSAAIRLSELGEEVLLIEGGSYPSHKVCGEFLSPECLKYLNRWNIYPTPIFKTVLQTPSRSLVFPFPSPAGGLSHLELDPALANYAKALGAKIKANTQVNQLKPKKKLSDDHIIELSTGEVLESSHLIIATGRIPNYHQKKPPARFIGFKAHFKNLSFPGENHLHMFSFDGAYLGISPVEDHKFNVACLADVKKVKQDHQPHLFVESLISQNPFLYSCFAQSENLFNSWMTAQVPNFGIKQTPNWSDVYFIGDASITIPPACGNGLSMAIYGGRLAADYAVHRQAHEFKREWMRRCSCQLFWGKILHKLMLNPFYFNPLIHLSDYFSYFSKKMFLLTRHPTYE